LNVADGGACSYHCAVNFLRYGTATCKDAVCITRRCDPVRPPRPSHVAEGGCFHVRRGPHQGTAGGAAGSTEEDLHKMDKLLLA